MPGSDVLGQVKPSHRYRRIRASWLTVQINQAQYLFFYKRLRLLPYAPSRLASSPGEAAHDTAFPARLRLDTGLT